MYLIFREQIDKINSTKVPYKEDTPVGNNYPEIRELLQQKADYQARLNLLPAGAAPASAVSRTGEVETDIVTIPPHTLFAGNGGGFSL